MPASIDSECEAISLVVLNAMSKFSAESQQPAEVLSRLWANGEYAAWMFA